MHVDHPASSLSAGSALSAGLVLVELSQAQNGVDNVRLVVHNDDGCGTQTTPPVLQVVEVHNGLFALRTGQHRHGGPTRNDGLQVAPAADDATTVTLDQLLEGDRHLLFDRARVVHVTRDAEKFDAGVVLASEGLKPVSSSAHDGRTDGDCLDVGDRGRAPIQAGVCGKWRLQTGAAGLALQGLDEASFLTANVGSSSRVHDDIEVVPGVASVFAQVAGGICLVACLLHLVDLVPELASNVDVSGLCAHGKTDKECAFHEFVGVVTHTNNVLSSVPVATLLSSFDEPVTIIVHIGENTILILQIAVCPHAHREYTHYPCHATLVLQEASSESPCCDFL